MKVFRSFSPLQLNGLSLFLYFFAALFIIRGVLASAGTVGLFHDWFVGPFPEMISNYGASGFQLYDLTLGNKIYPSDWIFRILLLPFSFLGGEIISKGLIIGFCTLSAFSMFYLGRTLKLSYLSSFLAGLIYLFSPIVFTRTIAGHIYYLLAFALAPFLLVTFIKAQKDAENRLKFSILSGIIFAIMGTQIQFFVMGFLILLALTLVDYHNFKKNMIILTIIIVVGVVLHLPWILPLLSTPSTTSLSTQSFLAYHEITSSPTLLEALRVIGYNIQPYSYTRLTAQGIMPNWVLYIGFLIPVVAFLALFVKRDKYTIGFSMIAIIGIFLSKGINPPFENLFVFAFQYTPLIIFRELWHIVFLVIFSYTILIAIFLNEINEKFRKKVNLAKSCVLALSLLIIVSNGYPLLLGNMGGYMQTYSFGEDYNNLFQSFQNDPNQYRILWLPTATPMKYDNNTLSGVDPLISYSLKPTFPQHIIPSQPLSRLAMFLTSTIHESKTQQFGNLISPYATEYVVARNDFESEYPHYVSLGLYPELSEKWSTNVTNSFIATQTDLTLDSETENFAVYRNLNNDGFLYSPATIIYGIKELSTLNYLAKIADLTDIAYLTDFTSLETANPIFIAKNGLDLTSIITGTKIDPGNYATETNAQNGWINSKNWFWYNYLFASTINNGAFSKTQSQLDIPIETKNISEIWVKTLRWKEGGTIKFTLNNENASYISAFSTAFTLEWAKIYDNISTQSNMLTISNIDGENYVDEILLINKQQCDQVESVLEQSTIIYLLDPTSFELANLVKPFQDTKQMTPADTAYWSNPESGFSSWVENDTRDSSIRVTTTLDSGWSWIRSPEIPITSGQQYLVSSSLKQTNAKATHIVIEGFNVTSGEWIQLVQAPSGQDGTFDWQSYKVTLTANEAISQLRVSLNAGSVLNETKGNATSWFGAISITLQQDSNELRLSANNCAARNINVLKEGYYKVLAEIKGSARISIGNQDFAANSGKYQLSEIGSVLLGEGNQHLELEALSQLQIGSIWLHTSPQNESFEDILTSKTKNANILESKQENPSYWQATVNASSPYLLIFAAPYDENWIAQSSNCIYKSVPTYGYITGFFINQTGILEITLEYKPQDLFNYGVIASLTILTGLASYLTYTFDKKARIWSKIKQSLSRLHL